jgi:hypothetical protein
MFDVLRVTPASRLFPVAGFKITTELSPREIDQLKTNKLSIERRQTRRFSLDSNLLLKLFSTEFPLKA